MWSARAEGFAEGLTLAHHQLALIGPQSLAAYSYSKQFQPYY